MANVNQAASGMGTKKAEIKAEPGKQELFIITEYDAPREMVFQAYTDPMLYEQWIGPRELTAKIERFEPRDGGRWRFIQKDKEGNEYSFHGVFHEVLAPERIIQTFEWEQLPEKGHVSLETAEFKALPGNRTRIVEHSVFQSVEDRDGMVQSGMESGVNDGYNRLTELLARMQK